MKKYAIVIDGKTVDRITAEDAESAARAYSAEKGLDSDLGFVRGVKMIDADTRGSAWAIIKTDGGDITAEKIQITTTPRPAGNPGRNEERMSTQKRNNKYDGMNKEQIIAKILEDVKSFFGPQDEKFAKAMYEELVANGTIKEK